MIAKAGEASKQAEQRNQMQKRRLRAACRAIAEWQHWRNRPAKVATLAEQQ